METRLNYPIKYAVLELKIKGGWISNYEDITIGFIVSKCYIVNQNIRYFQNGTNKVSYTVVFPYTNIEAFKNKLSRGNEYFEEPAIPKFNYHGECLNANTVLNIFDTFEEATESANKENRGIKSAIALRFNSIDDYNKSVKEFEENLNTCKLYEQYIDNQTNEMIITSETLHAKKLQRIKSE